MTKQQLLQIIDRPGVVIRFVDKVFYIVLPGVIKLRISKAYFCTKRLSNAGRRTLCYKSPLWFTLKRRMKKDEALYR